MIFDLDGTLIDSRLDLSSSVNATRRYMGLSELAPELVYTYVGDGAPVLMRRAMGPAMPQPEIDRALDFFIRYYHEHRLDHTTIYPGTCETLDSLRAAGCRMAVLTNKPVRISQSILAGLALEPYFFRVYGGNSFDEKKPSPAGILHLLSECGVARESALMVGDSAVDVLTARNAGIKSCGVTFGFQPETLAATAPDYLIHRMDELPGVVLNS